MADVSQFSFPTDIRYGVRSRDLLADFARTKQVRKPLLVTDSGLCHTEAFRLASEAVQRIWGDHHALFCDVQGNPTDLDVENAWAAYSRCRCDGVVGLGGGSAVDVAKALLN